MNLNTDDGTDVDRLYLRRHVPFRLWALDKCLERDSTDSSQGVLLCMEIILKLWEPCPEIIYICIL